MSQKAIVLTGLIRDERVFLHFLDAYETANLRSSIPLIFSTWAGELEKYPQVREKLHRVEAQVIEQFQPNLVMIGHALHQIVALSGALSQLPASTLVLKTRPDMCSPWHLFEFLKVSAEQIPRGPIPTPFEHRILVTGTQGIGPLYIDDMTFVGVVGDLIKLTLMPGVFPVRYFLMATEQLIWGGTLIPSVPVFDLYCQVNVGLIFNNEVLSDQLHSLMARSLLVSRVAACNMIIVQHCFGFFGDTSEAIDISSYTIEKLFWSDLSLDGVTHNPSAHANVYRSQAVTNSIVRGEFASSEMGERISHFIKEYSAPGAMFRMSQELEKLDAEAIEYAETCQHELGIYGQKILIGDRLQKRSNPRPPEWRMAQLGTSVTQALEEEVNHLRRTNDQLNSVISELKEGRLPETKKRNYFKRQKS